MSAADDFLSKLLAQSLQEIDSDGALAELGRRQGQAEQQQLAREAAIVRAALDSEAGTKFLTWLAFKTVLRGEGDAERGATTAEAYALAKAKRQGQAGVFFAICEALTWRPDAPETEKRETGL